MKRGLAIGLLGATILLAAPIASLAQAPAAPTEPGPQTPPMVPPAKPGVFAATKKGPTGYHLVVAGHNFTSRDAIEHYLAYRAAILTQEQKSSWFTLVENHAKGDTVKWTNPHNISHTVTFDPSKAATAANAALPAGVEPFDSGAVEEEGTFSHTFTVKGTYKYVCVYHEAMGMVGTVIVS